MSDLVFVPPRGTLNIARNLGNSGVPGVRLAIRTPRTSASRRSSNDLKNHVSPGRSGPLAQSQRLGGNSFQCPSEITSTFPSTTLMAVSSSIPYVGTGTPAAHASTLARELSGMDG